jgi:hypothetical protein
MSSSPAAVSLNWTRPRLRRSGSLGRRQQSLSPGRGEAKRGSRRRCCDHGGAGRRAEASRRLQRALQGARRSANRSRWRGHTEEVGPQAAEAPEDHRPSSRPKGRAAFEKGRKRRETYQTSLGLFDLAVGGVFDEGGLFAAIIGRTGSRPSECRAVRCGRSWRKANR